MTLGEIRTLLVSADPDIKHYFSVSDAPAYTYWEESERLPVVGDDEHLEQAWRFYVHHYSKAPYSPVADNLFAVLDADPRTAVRMTVDHDQDSGYTHYIFECEGY